MFLRYVKLQRNSDGIMKIDSQNSYKSATQACRVGVCTKVSGSINQDGNVFSFVQVPFTIGRRCSQVSYFKQINTKLFLR